MRDLDERNVCNLYGDLQKVDPDAPTSEVHARRDNDLQFRLVAQSLHSIADLIERRGNKIVSFTQGLRASGHGHFSVEYILIDRDALDFPDFADILTE